MEFRFVKLVRSILQFCFLIMIVSTVFSPVGWADTDAEKLLKTHHAKPDRYAGKDSMNGYSLKDFPDFYDTWKMVTTRYREDTKEMRFTYANDIAMRALKKKEKDYPDGAVFGKIGFISEEDPAFTSSVVPKGAKRYQFMVRDKKKFASTDGWGYVLLNGDGKTFNGDPEANSKACAACHRLVPDRGYVFSEPAEFSPYIEKMQAGVRAQPVNLATQKLKFKNVSRQELDERLARFLPSDAAKVRSLEGSLRENIFEGTVNEVGPFLVREGMKAKEPAVLISKSGDLFAFAYKTPQQGCEAGKSRYVVGRTITPSVRPKSNTDEVIVKVVSYCASTQ